MPATLPQEFATGSLCESCKNMSHHSLALAALERLAKSGGRCSSVDELFEHAKCSVSQRMKICQQLRQTGLIHFREVITRFGLTVAGKTLLKLDTSVWPVTPDELLILRSCARGRIGPGQIHPRVPANQRQTLLLQLAEKQLIMVYQKAIENIELTSFGQQQLGCSETI